MHKMKLQNKPFTMIKDGIKTIEMRLYDEKRSKININDKIEFTNALTDEKMLVRVVNIYKYKSFEELYQNHDKKSIGYKEDEQANPKDMSMYYSDEDISKYGVVGIEIKICDY